MAFSYRSRTREQLQRRADQSGSNRQGLVYDKYKVYTPKQGENRVRILPPTWRDADHYGIDVFAHYSIGMEGSSFVCLENPPIGHKPQDCPLCRERKKAADASEDDLAKNLRPNKRVCVWMIDRDREADGPQIWPMAYTIDRELANLVIDDDEGGGVFEIDNPDKGYDLIFKRSGRDERTKYEGLKLARKASPLSQNLDEQDDWLKFIEDNPLPDCLIVADPRVIEDEFNLGGVRARDNRDRDNSSRDRDDDRDRDRDRGRSRRDDDEDDRRTSRRHGRDDDRGRDRDSDRDRDRDSRRRAPEKPRNYDELERLSEDEMIELAKSQGIRLSDRDPILPQLAEEFGFNRREPERDRDRDRDDDRRASRARGEDRGRERMDSRDRGRDDPDSRSARRDREDREGSDREGDRTSRLRAGIERERERDLGRRAREDDRDRERDRDRDRDRR